MTQKEVSDNSLPNLRACCYRRCLSMLKSDPVHVGCGCYSYDGAWYRCLRQLWSIRIKDRIKARPWFTPSPPADCEYAFVGGWLICVSGSVQAWAAPLEALRKTQCGLMQREAGWWTISCRQINERISSSSSSARLLPLTRWSTSAVHSFTSLQRQQGLRRVASHCQLISPHSRLYHVFIGESWWVFFSFLFSEYLGHVFALKPRSKKVTSSIPSWCGSALSPDMHIRLN